MSTYLELCQNLRQECSEAGTGPGDVTSQTGRLAKIVKWVKDAWVDIQVSQSAWRWMRVTATVSTTEDDDDYAYGEFTDALTSSAITRFSHWWASDPEDRPKIYLSSSGAGNERWLTYTPWVYFKRIYKIGTQNSSAPVHITVDPQDNIVLGPPPDDTYVLTLDFQRGPQVLAADDDEPDMPSHFHELIVKEAMVRYAYTQVTAEVLARAERERMLLLNSLKANQLPQMRLAEPMA